MKPIAILMIACAALGQEPPAATFRSETRLVEVYASIFDNKGKHVDGIPQERFQLLDNGAPQPILHFEADSKDLTCAILLDTTGSMQGALAAVKNAVSKFLDRLRPDDSAGVFSFSTSLNVLQEFTTDRVAAKRAVLRTRAAGQTALFDALAATARAISERKGKKAIVLFTDGSDNASALRAESAIQRVLKTGVSVYAIAEGEATRSAELKKELRRITESTGGIFYESQTKDIDKVFDDIQGELKHVYLLSYKPPDGDRTRWHTVDLKIAGLDNYRIRGKRGYFPE